MLSKSEIKEGYVESEKVKLHYLDWGGDGDVLILIPGLGDTPFIFKSLAGKLSPEFRVISYARRNHWKSVCTDDRFDNEILVSDLKLLMDALHIEKASLLGWSMGGNEITEFAIQYPERVNKLIYFESGYDLSDGAFANLVDNIPKHYLPDSIVMRSLSRYRDWYHNFWFKDVEWNDDLEANLMNSVKINADSTLETIPIDIVFNTTLKQAMNYSRKYNKIKSPSLVIYAKPFFHTPDNNHETIALYNDLESNIIEPWRSANRKRIEQELPNSIIIDAPDGTHTSFLFLSSDFLVKSITAFLNAPD